MKVALTKYHEIVFLFRKLILLITFFFYGKTLVSIKRLIFDLIMSLKKGNTTIIF